MSNLNERRRFKSVLKSTCGILCAYSVIAAPALAQDGADEAEAKQETILVVGSQIQGAKVSGSLPVSVVSPDEIEATGAVSAEELFRTIPSAGDISFNGTYLGGGNSNAARGDVSTVSLRGLAQGNTLVLINGRRSVVHPTSQTDNQTPVFGYNVNAIPVQGLSRVARQRAIYDLLAEEMATDIHALALEVSDRPAGH